MRRRMLTKSMARRASEGSKRSFARTAGFLFGLRLRGRERAAVTLAVVVAGCLRSLHAAATGLPNR